MDTSSNRYSVAVLLEGRIGLCRDLAAESETAYVSPSDVSKTTVYTEGEFPIDAPVTVAYTPGVPQCDKPETIVYEQLGSPDDPPRSVAICPQRKCVAFGCKMGIELHWVDATTGIVLHRWFPLAAPSDHLYFLPQRQGVDSTKKLRLISSAGILGTQEYARGLESPDQRQTMTRLFFGSLPFPSATTAIIPSILPAQANQDDRQGVLRTVDCDHYRAIPLSDGIHILFTDPTSGLLCLGSDAPLGGPTKLIKKFVFLPPGYISTTTKLLPICYAAAKELQWGLRIAAVYADGSLVLFNIPSDCFDHVRYLRSTPDIWDEHAGVFAQSDLLMDVMLDLQHDGEHFRSVPEFVSHSQTHSHSRPFRTIQVPGIRVTTVPTEVNDIAVCGFAA